METDNFSNRFKADSFLSSTWEAFKNYSKLINLKVDIRGVSFDPNLYKDQALVNCLKSFTESLPEPGEAARIPVLFIDEANCLKIMEKNNEAEAHVLDNFFKWVINFVKVEENNQKMQIVFVLQINFF